MRFRYVAVAGFLLLVIVASSFPQASNQSVVLPESAAKELTHPYGRWGPPRFDGPWLPKEADVKAMEARFSGISLLHSNGGSKGMQIKHPESYFCQYVGIIVDKHKIIYINAFCQNMAPKDWRQRPVNVFDGGACYWGAMYDTVSGEFSDLNVNGVG